MGECRHCRQSAGVLRSVHKTCKQAYAEATSDWSVAARDMAFGAIPLSRSGEIFAGLQRNAYLTERDRTAGLIHGFRLALDHFLDDNVVDEHEERRLLEFVGASSLDQDALDVQRAWTQFVKALIVRDLLGGKVPQRCQVNRPPFNLMKSETLLWIFPRVEYLKHKKKREYRGSSSGMSVRIMKGVYYRTSAFKGYPVETVECQSQGYGQLGVTTKHLYFAGERSFRVRLNKVVTFEPYEDGLGFMRDTQTALPEAFKLDDGWFAYNLATNAHLV